VTPPAPSWCLAGLALAIVGHLGRRRFTTWVGALVVPYALVAIVVAIVSDDNRVGGGVLLALFGAALVVVCAFLPSIWQTRAPRDGSAAPPPAATAP
jgi:hypothetical protein